MLALGFNHFCDRLDVEECNPGETVDEYAKNESAKNPSNIIFIRISMT